MGGDDVAAAAESLVEALRLSVIFILGPDDPYLSIERARTSINRIHGAKLYEVPGGHAPWLADAQQAAELITTHSRFATGAHLTLAAGERRQANPSA